MRESAILPDGAAILVRLMKAGLFVGAFLLAWVTLQPFADLRSNIGLELGSGREGATYAAFALLMLGTAGHALLAAPRRLLALVTPFSLVLGLWLAWTVLGSQDFSASVRRFVLFCLVAAVSAGLFLLPAGRRDLARLMCLVVGIMAGLSLIGVALFPDYAVHQPTDILEPQLAGDWRGVFAHKNTAGAVFAMAAFFMIHAARSGFPVAGTALGALCALFLVMAGAKSALMLFIVTLAVTAVFSLARRAWIKVAAALVPLAALLLLGPGTIVNETLAGIVGALPVDLTFTGRTDIWEFALEKVFERPLRGFGFGAFWSLQETRFGAEDSTQWAGTASHAHNGYLDAALNLGFPGLVLTLIVFVAQPLRDYLAARRAGADPALTTLLLQVFLFGVYLSVMESFLYGRFDPIWVTFLFAVFGLRYVATFPAVRD